MQLPSYICVPSWSENWTVCQRVSLARSWLSLAVRVGEHNFSTHHHHQCTGDICCPVQTDRQTDRQSSMQCLHRQSFSHESCYAVAALPSFVADVSRGHALSDTPMQSHLLSCRTCLLLTHPRHAVSSQNTAGTSETCVNSGTLVSVSRLTLIFSSCPVKQRLHKVTFWNLCNMIFPTIQRWPSP